MQHRRLGSSGLRVSQIAYGNWLTHGSQIEAEQATACVRAALEAGITTFDTADVYANTAAEDVLGKALAGERREGLEIATKVFFPTGPGVDAGGPGPNDHGLSRKHIRDSVHGSLKRLRTDYIDLYQAHRFDHETPLEETMEAFADLVHSGKVLYVGASEWTADQLRAGHALARELRIPFVSNQPQYNMLWRVIEGEVVPTSQELGIGQICWSPMAQGVLTGKYRAGQDVPAGSRATDERGKPMMEHLLKEKILHRVDELRPIADDLGCSMGQLALAWVLARPGVSAAIMGASRPEQVAENVAACHVELTDDVMATIDAAVGPIVQSDPSRTVSPVRSETF